MIEMRDVRGRVLEIVSSLYQVELQVRTLAEFIPLPDDVERMWESQIPTTALVNLYGALNAVRSDCLVAAIATLVRAGRQDDLSLRGEFPRRREPAPESSSEGVCNLFADAESSGISWNGGVSFQKSQEPGEGAERKEPPPCSD